MSVPIDQVQAEHHESGFAIGSAEPRLSWRFNSSDARDWVQTSYEITLKRSDAEAEVYKVNSAESVLAPWPSAPLKSREIVDVTVAVTGSDGKTTPPASITIEAALLERSDWKAKLISSTTKQPKKAKTPFKVRQKFTAGKGRARLYSTAHGIYDVEISGKRVGDQVLAPGWQSYHHHLNYQTYDVAELLKDGENEIVAYVGEGWYAGRLGRPGTRDLWGDRLGFFGQLELDGKVILATDESWEWLDGPVITSEIYDGETIDTRKKDEVKGKVDVLGDISAELISSDAPPVRRVEEVAAVELITTPSGKTVLDFGQNLVGWVRIEKDIPGEGELCIRYAEVLERGELGTRPLRTAKSQNMIILGGSTKGWEPRFTFHGFRYIEVTGYKPDISDFKAIVVFSDLRRTGTFNCSHSMINQLHSNVVWSMMGNFVSIPTDCPQRDERLGWTGDIQVFAPTANYLYDTSGFLFGWLKDVAAETTKDWNGVTPVTVPHIPSLNRPVPIPQAIWADCTALTPWDLYSTFGDRSILEKQYESMVMWLEKGVPREENRLWSFEVALYGDWLDPRAPPSYPAHGQTNTHLAANAYLVYTTNMVARIGTLLGQPDAKKWEAEAKELRKEFQREYVTPKGNLMSDTQAAIALALKFGLVEKDQQEALVKRLDWLVRWDGFKISTGFAGTPIILDVLAENGLLHHAYRMLQEKDNPSWLYPVSMGATAIWERWDSMLPNGDINPGQMTSFNHYALGAVAAFLHGTVGGLSILEPGWKKALVRPKPGGTITSAETRFDSPFGPYSVSWKLDGEKMSVDVEVPPNGSAQVVLPGIDEVVGSGKRHYDVTWQADKRWPPKSLEGPQGVKMPDVFVP